MPKKDKRKGPRGSPASVQADDDDVESIASDVTISTCANSEDEVSTTEAEVYENKIKEAIDLAAEKSVHTRTNALISLKTALQKRVTTTFLHDYHHTLSDIVERSLKKGKGNEQVAAAKLGSALITSLVGTEESEMVYNLLYPQLSSLVQNTTASVEARKAAAHSIALLAYFACPEPADLTSTLNILHNIFCCSLPKGDGNLPSHSPAVLSLHAAALQGVCLLLTLLSPSTVYTMAQKLLEELTPVLATTDLELRIMVGEALALVHESARCHDEDFRWRKEEQVIDKLNEFVNESHKYRAKKDLKTQRASFREIVLTIEEGEPLSEAVLVGPSYYRQELVLCTWSLKFQYQAICHALEQGLNCHMTNNIGLRNHFELGPLPDNPFLMNKKQKKSNRQTAEARARNMNRGKNRDNRAAALTYDDE